MWSRALARVNPWKQTRPNARDYTVHRSRSQRNTRSHHRQRVQRRYTGGMDSDRFEKQLRFILEIDKLKAIARRTYLLSADRHENSAEHSWHLAIMAVLLA